MAPRYPNCSKQSRSFFEMLTIACSIDLWRHQKKHSRSEREEATAAQCNNGPAGRRRFLTPFCG
jgi:hypothetical protein